MLRFSFHSRTFNFNFDARTSRGAMREKKSWLIKIWDDLDAALCGWGECGPLPGLSPENFTALEPRLSAIGCYINAASLTTADFVGADRSLEGLRQALYSNLGKDIISNNSSLAFALETALLDLANGGSHIIFHNDFVKGVPIPINGLVWMGNLESMLQQVEIKIRAGFTCIKLKIGGLDFEKEFDIVQFMRRKYFRSDITIRLDANGAFSAEDALIKIERLFLFKIHSIEQPMKVGAPELAALCKASPIPIALDEELIGVHERAAKVALLDKIKPAYIILKPTLHGGLFGCMEWIELAKARGIGFWITSALESNVGLNAASQLAGEFQNLLPQGLGTGAIYENNIAAPLTVKKGYLVYNAAIGWDPEII